MTKPNLRGLRWLAMLCISLSLSAQHAGPYDLSSYQYLQAEGQIPHEFLTTADQKFESIVDSLSSVSDGRRDLKQMERYWRHYLHYVSFTLSSGQVIFGDPITIYLNEIKDRLLAGDPRLQSRIKVYLAKDPEVNAFAGGDGKIFVNLGLMAHMQSEDELAFILAHEITHYRESHGLEAFRHREEAENDGFFSFGREKPFDEFTRLRDRSQADELEADIKGAELFLKSSYRPQAMISALSNLHRSYLPFAHTSLTPSFIPLKSQTEPSVYQLQELRPLSENENFVDESHSHPNIARRKRALRELYSEQLASSDNSASNDKSRFTELQLLARFELIRLQMIYFQYQSALFNLNELMQQYPGNSFLLEAKARSLYALAMYRVSGQGDRVISGYSLVEGEAQQLAYLLRQMGKDDFYAAAMQSLYETAQALPQKSTEFRELATILTAYYRYFAAVDKEAGLKTALAGSIIGISPALYQDWLPQLWSESTPLQPRFASKEWFDKEERRELAEEKELKRKKVLSDLQGKSINVISPDIILAEPENLESQEMMAAAQLDLENSATKLARKMKPGQLNMFLSRNLITADVAAYNQRSRLLEITNHQLAFNNRGLIPESAGSDNADHLALASPLVMVARLDQDYYGYHLYHNCILDINSGQKIVTLEEEVGQFEVNQLAPTIIDNLKALK